MTDEYADARLQRVLAEDVAIAELGIEIVTRGDCTVLHGHVESPERRDEIERRVAAHLSGHRVVNEIVVVAVHPPAGAEELP